MKVLIMYLRFSIFKLLLSSSPKLYLLHFKNLFWCLLNVDFCHNFAKLHRSHMTLIPFEILLKHKRLRLLLSFQISTHLTSYNERSCYFCCNPTLRRVWGWDSHSRNGDLGVRRDLGVLQDSWNFKVQLQGSKYLVLWRSLYHWKTIET
jgi:hypothetical protein